MKRLRPNKGSVNDKLSSLDVGERIYIDTTLDVFKKDMRQIHSGKTRRPQILDGREFTTSLLTAVTSGKAGDVRYLICIERAI